MRLPAIRRHSPGLSVKRKLRPLSIIRTSAPSTDIGERGRGVELRTSNHAFADAALPGRGHGCGMVMGREGVGSGMVRA